MCISAMPGGQDIDGRLLDYQRYGRARNMTSYLTRILVLPIVQVLAAYTFVTGFTLGLSLGLICTVDGRGRGMVQDAVVSKPDRGFKVSCKKWVSGSLADRSASSASFSAIKIYG